MCAVSVLLFMFSLLLVLCFCFVASVFADVASVFDAVVFARSLARSLSRCLFQLAHNNLTQEVRVHTQQPRQQ